MKPSLLMTSMDGNHLTANAPTNTFGANCDDVKNRCTNGAKQTKCSLTPAKKACTSLVGTMRKEKTTTFLGWSKLGMSGQCHELLTAAGWKLRTLLRARRFYSTKQLVNLYKCHVLSFVEFSTPAIFHATATALKEVGRVQKRFLRELNMTSETALTEHNLAPLHTRTDIAMLGLIHRTVLGLGPPHFREWFFPTQCASHKYNTKWQSNKHNKQLHDYVDGRHSELLRNSALGLVRVYNGLTQETVDAKTVSDFQTLLQEDLKMLVQQGTPCWEYRYSQRKCNRN